MPWPLFIENLSSKATFCVCICSRTDRTSALEFESANPSVVKSIKQRDLLNTWLRLYAREQKIPDIADYRPERIEDALPGLCYFDVYAAAAPPKITIQSDGTRISAAYGHTGKGRPLEDYIG